MGLEDEDASVISKIIRCFFWISYLIRLQSIFVYTYDRNPTTAIVFQVNDGIAGPVSDKICQISRGNVKGTKVIRFDLASAAVGIKPICKNDVTTVARSEYESINSITTVQIVIASATVQPVITSHHPCQPILAITTHEHVSTFATV